MRRAALLLLPLGPLCVALLRFVLPYYTANSSLATARAVEAHPARESTVLWLGLVAMVTLVPGVLTVAAALPPTRLRAWALGLSIPGYLCLGVLLAEDYLLSAGARAHVDPHQLAAQLDAIHPSHTVGLAVFVVGHVTGTVLLGIALLKSGRIPVWAAWTLALSQPLHFLAAVILGSPPLDLVAWCMTAIGMGAVARAVISELPKNAPDHDLASDLDTARRDHAVTRRVRHNPSVASVGTSSATTPSVLAAVSTAHTRNEPEPSHPAHISTAEASEPRPATRPNRRTGGRSRLIRVSRQNRAENG